MVVRFLYAHASVERLVEGDPDVLIDHRRRARGVTEARAEYTRFGLGAAAHKRASRRWTKNRPRYFSRPGGILLLAKNRQQQRFATRSARASSRLSAQVAALHHERTRTKTQTSQAQQTRFGKALL